MEVLRRWMDETGTTQVELAKQCGVSQPTVSDWINGNICPTVDNILVLSKATRIPVERLVREAAAA